MPNLRSFSRPLRELLETRLLVAVGAWLDKARLVFTHKNGVLVYLLI